MPPQNSKLAYSQSVAAVIHALNLARTQCWNDDSLLFESLRESEKWADSHLGFASRVPARAFRPNDIRLSETEPDLIFARVSKSIAELLFVGLAGFADEILGYELGRLGAPDLNDVTSKIEWVASKLRKAHAESCGASDYPHEWAICGLFEVVAIRNALVHNSGYWNDRGLGILRLAGVESVDMEAPISITFSDVFRYRRAVRTIHGEIEKQANQSVQTRPTSRPV